MEKIHACSFSLSRGAAWFGASLRTFLLINNHPGVRPPLLVPLRPSSEHILIVRAPGAQRTNQAVTPLLILPRPVVLRPNALASSRPPGLP